MRERLKTHHIINFCITFCKYTYVSVNN